jgi:hypothetical protein
MPSDLRLWNPNAAANWSLIFSPAFGAFLHARNAEALGRTREAKANQKWFYATLIFYALLIFTSYIPAIPESSTRFIALIMLLVWYFRLGAKQIKYVKATCPDGYQRKPWTKPLVIAIAAIIAFISVGTIAEYFVPS